MQYKETEKPLSEIARELNVDTIVEGTVYQVGDSIRVRFQLIDVLPEEKNLWGETYKRATSNALVLYNDVAQSITNQIRVRLTNDEKTRFARTRSVNPEAYEAYLKGMSHWYKLTHADLETALQYFESAVEKDPDYALGWSGIARAWGGLKQMGAVEPGVATPRAKKAIQKALELDSTLAEVHYQLAVQRTWTDWDWVAAEKSFKRALEFNPNYPDALVYYSHLLSYMGRAEEGLVMADKALELDPLNSLYSSISGTLLLIMHRYDEAIERFQPGLRTSPYDPVANSGLQEAYHMKGMYEEALAAAKMSYIGMGLKQLAQLVDTWYEQGGYETAMSLVCKAMEDVAKQVYVSPLFISYSYVFAGKKDRVLDLLEKGYEVGDPNMPYIIEPCFTSLLGEEPRYQELLHKMNLPVGK